jgi:RNA polymerase sigma-70 factor (subfamily 1)
MMSENGQQHQRGDSTNLAETIQRARLGSTDAMGELFDRCREYLLLVANQELSSTLRAKAGGSDLVQDTFLKAQRRFRFFHGTTKPELLRWLRRILLNHLASVRRQYVTSQKRCVAREIPFDADDDECLASEVILIRETPSDLVIRDERERILNAAIARLPEAFQQLIMWRQREDVPFQVIAQRLEISNAAARKRWTRAVAQLKTELAVTAPDYVSRFRCG